jgi:diguanylate cyclase (GGDEF)-like protein/PAS domain S-box-containing protein
MHLEKVLLLVDNKELVFSYELLLKKYGRLDVALLSNTHKVADVEFGGYLVIIADLHLQKNVEEFLEFANFYSFSRELLVLISAFDSASLQKLNISLKNISFIIKKPFLTTKLTQFMDKEIYKMKQVSLISSKADILIDIYDLHPSRICVYDSDGFFYYANLKYTEAYSIAFEGQSKLHFNDIRKCEYDFSAIKAKLFVLKSFSFEKKEQSSWQESLFFYTNSKYVIHMVSDITSKKEKELRLQLASSFFENTNEGIIVANKKGDIESVNRAFSSITGYSDEEALGKNPRMLKSGLHDNDFYKVMWNTIKANGHWKGQIWNKRKNGQVYPQILSISKTAKSASQEEYYMSVFTDISSLKKADEKVYYHANYDSLTALPNRAYFAKQLEDMLSAAKKDKTQVALFFIDVDKFKEVNDSYGHNVGDEMLIAIAKRLQNSVRNEDFVARIGGDEFVLIAKDIKSKENVEKLCLKVQKKVNERLELDTQSFNMSLSMGVAIYPDHGLESQELLKNADIAMYEVKENGRNNFKIYEAFMSHKINTKNTLLQEIKKAFLRNEFVVYYQPMIDFKTQRVSGAEALVRWNHPERGLLVPDEFLHYIFNSDSEKKFGDFIIERVLGDMKKLNAIFYNHSLVIAINISREHFHSSSFCSDISLVLQKYNVEPSQIELEILETQLIHNKELSKQTIADLRRIGIKISLDDFGMEYSSLNYLKQFEVDKLKIDKSFIQNIDKDMYDLKIVHSIINIAKVFDLNIQAEGVETLSQYNKLKELGCDFSQGYYHAKPMAFEEFLGYYKQSMKESKK